MRHKRDTQIERAKKAGRSQPAQSLAERKAIAEVMARNKRLDNNNPPPDLADARARLAAAQAEKQETDNLIRGGKIHNNDDCDRANNEHGNHVRTALMNAGNQLATALVGLDARSIKIELDRWAIESLESFGKWASERHTDK